VANRDDKIFDEDLDKDMMQIRYYMEKNDLFKGRKGLLWCQTILASFVILSSALFVLILLYEYQPEKIVALPLNADL
jgi:hypothetical protein